MRVCVYAASSAKVAPEFHAAARARKAFMHGPLDVVARATPPNAKYAWPSATPNTRRS